MKLILQNNNQDCLLACYAMILNSFGSEIPIHYLYKEDIIPADGLSVAYLNTLNEKYKIHMKAYRIKKNNITILPDIIRCPLIAQWNGNHFVVIEKIRNNYILVLDPAFGKIRYSIKDFNKNFTGIIIKFTKKDDYQEIKIENEYWKIVKKTINIKNVFALTFSVVLGQLSMLGFSELLRRIMSQNIKLNLSLMFFLVIIITVIFSYIIRYISLTQYNKLYENIVVSDVIIGIFKKPLLYFRNNSIGSLIEKIGLKDTVRDIITTVILPSFCNLAIIVIVVLYMFKISIHLTGIFMVLTMLYIMLSHIIYKYYIDLSMIYLQRNIEQTTLIQEDLEQIDIILATRTQIFAKNKWKNMSMEVMKSNNRLIKISSWSSMVTEIFQYMSLTLILLIGVFYRSQLNISIADMVVFQTTISICFNAVQSLQTTLFEMNRLKAYSEKLSDILASGQKRKTIIRNIESDNALELKNIKFSFNKSNEIFSNLCLNIKKGEKVAIVGESGTGKTTLINIMLGLYNCEGEIIYGFSNPKERIGIALQNMPLSRGTIYENLVGDTEMKIEEIYEVLNSVNILDTIKSLPKGLFSSLYQSGKNLSGGQIQRLIIAKSLIGGKEIIFWDEPFSSVDRRTRKKIYHSIINGNQYDNNTFIISTHHLDLLPIVHKVVFIQKGTNNVIIGKHFDLLDDCEEYREFVLGG